uniref:NS5-like protein n=14 Tax=Yanggou tick virus TaxID=2560020 RepID=A0A482LW79_9FLAV|nr:NS5-like protein [Yanggou tick virus]QBQ65057.1 NS5-like protein [Yanggou tick virus]
MEADAFMAGLAMVVMVLVAGLIQLYENYQVHASYVFTPEGKMEMYRGDGLKTWKLEPVLGDPLDLGRKAKVEMNAMTYDEFDRMKYRGVVAEAYSGDKPSKGYDKLRVLMDLMDRPTLGTTVDLCAGRGGWSELVKDLEGPGGITAVSLWERGKEEWMADPAIRRINANVKHLKPWRVDTLLFDGGETFKRDQNIKKEEDYNDALLDAVDSWMMQPHPPENFIIKIQVPYTRKALSLMEKWQTRTNKGRLVRLAGERLSNTVMYFISDRLETQLRGRVVSFLRELVERRKDRSLTSDPSLRYERVKPKWTPEPVIEGCRPLDTLDMSRSIREMKINRPPLGITHFFKEIGYKVAEKRGSEGTRRNRFVDALIGPLKRVLERHHVFGAWQLTSTTPRAVFNIFRSKVDKAPVEHHDHYPGLKKMYELLADLWLSRHGKLKRLSEEEMAAAINRRGAMGFQMENRGFPDLGAYWDSGEWRADVNSFKQSLMAGKPTHGVYNTTAKKEKTKNLTRQINKGSRIIQYLPADARLYELKVLGGLHKYLEKCSWSVAGQGLYRYGDLVVRAMRATGSAIAEDIAGWDTKVSKGLLTLEAHMFTRLADDEEMKQEIHNLYRLYANPHMMVQREIEGEIHEVLLRGRGQVSSGRQPTYAANTITNFVTTLYGLARTLEIQETDWPRLIRDLTEGVGARRMLVSGDDKVLFLTGEEARRYAKKAFVYGNEMGLVRKNMGLEQESEIITDVKEISFCSHQYWPVKYGDETHYMPVRDIGEIVAKATMALGVYRDDSTQEAWARVQGFNMLVNYHHIPECRMLALAILSATRIGLNLKGISKGWMMSTEWLRDDLGPDTIHKLITQGRSSGWNQLGYVDYKDRKGLLLTPDKHYKEWRRAIPDLVDGLRIEGHGYKNWLEKMAVFH